MNTAPAPSDRELYDIPIAEIDRTHNYRKTYDEAKLAQLAESIDAQGILEPVIVRPSADGAKLPWALVVGERRVRASLIAKKKTVPAIIRRDLDAASGRTISIVENLQREDVDALEEADGFGELYDPPNAWPVDKIAAQVGQKKSYVYGRLKLRSLCDEGRKAYREGDIDLSTAILIARIASKETQALAVESYDWQNINYDHAARIIHERFMLRLAGAPFDTTDEGLVAEAGSCAKCPKRTGNQRELFDEVKGASADVCTDPPCFRRKADAAWVVQAAAAEKKGARILSDADAAKLFPHGAQLAHAAPYVDLAEPCYEDSKRRPFKKLVAKGTPVVLARDPSGGIRELVPRSELAAAMKGSGVRFGQAAASRSSGSAEGLARERAERKKAERKRAVVQATIAEVVAKAKPTLGVFRAMLSMLVRGGYHDALVNLARRRGWVEKGKQPRAIVEAKAKAMADADLFPLVLELLVSRDAYWTHAVGIPDSVQRAASATGVDIKAIEKRIGAEAKVKERVRAKAKATVANAGKKKKGGRK